ncbi:hypothetical protein AX14_012118 [Amanita brunnescens Koide BX004]|nr:hypothetical protein AX14_012118 [Amanita brunnescens Koide BX004]
MAESTWPEVTCLLRTQRCIAPDCTTPTASPMFLRKSEPSNLTSSKSEQPTVEQLAKLGISVRDFAYESTLPPVAPVYFLPKQVQPDPRVTRPEQGHPLPLFRQLSVNTIESDRNPAPPPGGVTRQRGFSDLRDYGPYYIDIPDSQESGSQPSLAYSDEYVKTPVVTPNGSLQWQDADIGDIPTGTPIRPLSLAATELGSPSLTTTTASSPLSSVHSSFRISPSPKARSVSPKHRARRSSVLSNDLVPATSGSRYYLRKRPGRKDTSTISGKTRASAGQKKRTLRQLV